MNREEAIEILKSAIKKPNTKDGYLGQALTMGIKALENQKVGHWEETEDYNSDVLYRCSACESVFYLEVGTPKDNEYKYCPCCGAKMEGENK